MMKAVGILVCGVGRAGSVRLRDIARSTEYQTAFPVLQGVQLQGFTSRRELEIEGQKQLDFQEALAHPDVDCVLVCTENCKHEENARQALSAGKHVLVEFPLASSYAAGKELLDLAESKGVKLLEENILLLTEQMKNIMAMSKEKTVNHAFVSLKGKFSSSADMSVKESGSVFIWNLHYLHCLVLTCGSLQPHSATVTIKDNGDLQATATLTTKDNGEAEMQFEYTHDESVTRTSTYKFEFSDGTVLTNPPPVRPAPPQPPKPGLFMEDFISFVGAVRGTQDHYLPPSVSLEALQLADALQALANAKTNN